MYRQFLEQVSGATVVAVSKTHSLPEIMNVYNEGCRNFGENKVQEALPKIAQAPKDILWHFIGTLQNNKVRKVVGQFALIHSVDSIELAKKISEVSQELGVTTNILLQVNTSQEETKHGFTTDALRQQFPLLQKLPNLSIEGLMTMAPYTEDTQRIRSCFSQLRQLRDELNLKQLSMGMSHDWPLALEEGATILRIGSAIFGERS